MKRFTKHVLITGTARSGTSWLAETLAAPYRYRLLFEPEHETRTPKGRLLCDRWLQGPAPEAPETKYLLKVLQNRVDCDWIAQSSNRKFKMHLWPFLPKKFIIKCVRGNLMGHYINRRFKVPVVHVIRNPYAVLHSQKRSSFPWLQDLHLFSEQQELVALIKHTYGLDLTQADSYSVTERRTIRWCIENVLPLELWKFQESESYHVVRYEALFSDVQAFLDLCARVQLQPVANLAERYRKPSTKTHKNSALLSPKKQNPEEHQLSVQEREAVTKILRIFKTQLYPLEDTH